MKKLALLLVVGVLSMSVTACALPGESTHRIIYDNEGNITKEERIYYDLRGNETERWVKVIE